MLHEVSPLATDKTVTEGSMLNQTHNRQGDKHTDTHAHTDTHTHTSKGDRSQWYGLKLTPLVIQSTLSIYDSKPWNETGEGEGREREGGREICDTLSVSNTTFVYLTTPEKRKPHYSGHYNLVLIHCIHIYYIYVYTSS